MKSLLEESKTLFEESVKSLKLGNLPENPRNYMSNVKDILKENNKIQGKQLNIIYISKIIFSELQID